VAGSCEHGNEHSNTIKDEEFICQLNDSQFLKDSAPVS
jgi:hypothetical protein